MDGCLVATAEMGARRSRLWLLHCRSGGDRDELGTDKSSLSGEATYVVVELRERKKFVSSVLQSTQMERPLGGHTAGAMRCTLQRQHGAARISQAKSDAEL